MTQKLRTDLSKFNPKAFDRGASSLKFFLWHWVNIIFFVSPFCPSSAIRCFLLRLFGARVGKGVIISKPGVNVKFPWRLSIGNHVWIGENAWIYNLDKVVIGNNVNIAQGAMILTGNHNYKSTVFETIYGPVTIEDGVFIGAKSIVCPNVVCKTESILAAGSVATSNLDAYGIYQGNPAVFKKERVING